MGARGEMRSPIGNSGAVWWPKWFALLSALCLLVLCLACGETENASAPGGMEGERPDQESWDSQVTVWDLGEPRAVVRAGHLRTYEKKRTVEIDEGLRIDFFDEEGEHTARLTAQGGTMDEMTKDVKAVGGVVVVSDQGDTLRTELLRWSNTQEKIYGDGPVEIVTEDASEKGVGFEASPDLESWTMREIVGRVRREERIPRE